MWQYTKPAAPGIFPASTERNPEARRLWNGKRWSAPWYADDPEAIAQRAQLTSARIEQGLRVEWLKVDHAQA